MKSVLVHIQDDDSLEQRVESGLALARACGGHLTCLHVTPLEAYVSFDSFGGVFVMKDVLEALDEREKALRERVEADLANELVPYDYEQVTGPVANMLVSRAALADVVVVGRERHREAATTPPVSLLGDLLYRSRTPLFLPGGSAPARLDGPALIAWDGSYEAANAVRAGLMLLRCASEVKVIRIGEPSEAAMFPSTRLLEYLSRHGIHPELVEVDGHERHLGERLVGEAERHKAAFMVLGGYSHSRFGEYIFGGVTRDLLTACPVSLLVAH